MKINHHQLDKILNEYAKLLFQKNDFVWINIDGRIRFKLDHIEDVKEEIIERAYYFSENKFMKCAIKAALGRKWLQDKDIRLVKYEISKDTVAEETKTKETD